MKNSLGLFNSDLHIKEQLGTFYRFGERVVVVTCHYYDLQQCQTLDNARNAHVFFSDWLIEDFADICLK